MKSNCRHLYDRVILVGLGWVGVGLGLGLGLGWSWIGIGFLKNQTLGIEVGGWVGMVHNKATLWPLTHWGFSHGPSVAIFHQNIPMYTFF